MAIALTIFILIFVPFSFYYLVRGKHQASSAMGELKRAEDEIAFMRQDKRNSEERSEEKIDFLRRNLLKFEKQNELLKQQQNQLEKQQQEWQQDKELILAKLSEELMRKNHEQQHQISEKQQANIKKITEDLFKNFESVTSKLTALDDEVKKSSLEVTQTRNALLTPGGAGRTAEITLENILKNSNLLEKETLSSPGDYILQSHFSSSTKTDGKRPDAILFLPNNQILVIDSKSSSHFLELEEAQSDENKKEVLGKIKNSFKKHLEDLKRKDYAEFLFAELSSLNLSDYKIFSVMFLQTEQMLEVIKKSDRDFEKRALDAKIIIATPISLIHLLSSAKFIIDRFKQEKNIEALKIEVQKLMDALAMIVKDSSDLGRLVNRALTGYNKLAKHLNKATSLSRNISELGIEGKKSGDVKMLDEFEVDEDESS